MDCFALKFYHNKKRESSTITPELSNKRIDFPSCHNDMVVNSLLRGKFYFGRKKARKSDQEPIQFYRVLHPM